MPGPGLDWFWVFSSLQLKVLIPWCTYCTIFISFSFSLVFVFDIWDLFPSISFAVAPLSIIGCICYIIPLSIEANHCLLKLIIHELEVYIWYIIGRYFKDLILVDLSKIFDFFVWNFLGDVHLLYPKLKLNFQLRSIWCCHFMNNLAGLALEFDLNVRCFCIWLVKK